MAQSTPKNVRPACRRQGQLEEQSACRCCTDSASHVLWYWLRIRHCAVEEFHLIAAFLGTVPTLLAPFPDAVHTFVPVLLVHKTTTDARVKSETLSSGVRALDLIHHVLVAIVLAAALVQSGVRWVASDVTKPRHEYAQQLRGF